MSEPKTQQEPTMEEILASIRRIISEDGEEPKTASASAAPAVLQTSVVEEDVLELTQMVKDDGSVVNLTDARPAPAVVEARPESVQPRASAPAAEPPRAPRLKPAAEEQPLVSSQSAAAATSAFTNLTSAVMAGSRNVPLGDGQRTIEDLVKELLRPMLKEWLDDHLPDVVQKIVEREVAKLARRAEDDSRY